MDLKFSFDGASPDQHGHGGAPSGIPLPFSTAPSSTSSVLEMHARLSTSGVIAEALSGDGVSYGHAEINVPDREAPALAKALRSALSRVVAELNGPLSESVKVIHLNLEGAEAGVFSELGVDATTPAITEALQSRIGLAAGTEIRVAA